MTGAAGAGTTVRIVLLLLLCLAGGCAAMPSADPAHPVATSGWVETRLSFGLGSAEAPASNPSGIGEARWRAFLDREVTPRFPSGLSVLDMYGQWQDPGAATPERLRSKLLVIDHPDDAADADRIEAIRAAWKRLTGDRSVLTVTQTARVSF